MMRTLLLALGLLFAGPTARADTWLATYDAYVAGANAMRLTAAFRMDHAGYKMEVQARTLGVLDVFVGSRQFSQVEGIWQGGAARPRQFRAEGLWKGERRATLIDYHGGVPTVRDLVPTEPSRESVPIAGRQDALDRLSPLAFLARRIGQTGKCDAAATTYDGRRLEETVSRSAGWEELPVSGHSIFAGRALRCEIALRIIAGFTADEDRAHAGRIRRAEVWVASPAPDAPAMPVRLKLDAGWLGSAVVYLSDLQRAIP